MTDPKQLTPEEIAQELSAKMDADVLLYNGPIDPPLDLRLMQLIHGRKRKRPNVILLLVTFGGDADCAYRIAKCLQTEYDKFTLFVSGYCKSAGSLIALGAHELVFGKYGELGPLDVQMSKKDSLWEAQSGLTVYDCLVDLQDKAYLAFERFFLETENRSQGAITVKTAAKIATQLSVGLFTPLYSQIDPMHVGEAARAMRVADHYGRLLLKESGNFDYDSLHHLISHYPSHGFVIDQEEASGLFNNLRSPFELEAQLAEALELYAIIPTGDEKSSVIQFLSIERSQDVSVAPAATRADAIPEPDHETPTEVFIHDTHTGGENGREQADTRAAAPRPATQPGA